MLSASALAQKPSATVTLLEPGERIEIDGALEDPAWQRASELGPLTQVEPVEGAEPTWPTRVRVAIDADFFYLAIECFDDPSQVRARQRDRDAFVRYDDVCEWWLDTFHDARFAFWFQATAAGSLGDALISDGGDSFNKNWDGIWYGEVLRTANGWQAEIAIPFQTLAFDPSREVWGFNLMRKRVANGEENRWAGASLAYRSFQLSEGGILHGMQGLRQGLGLDVVPYVKGSAHEREDEDEIESDADAGADLAWRPSPETNLRVTFNTDFAETEVDARRANLTRFPLFFPEKRDFFLEDAGLFEFGPSRGPGSEPTVLPFFSRRVGRDNEGNAVPILAGIKWTGRLDGWNVGLLNTLLDANQDLDEKNLGALRLSKNLGGTSALGMIFTHGRPDEEGDAFTAGIDFRLGSPRAFGAGRSGDLWGWWLASGAEGSGGEGDAFGVRARVRDATWFHDANVQSLSAGFDPALGFVRRSGVRMYSWQSTYRWRSAGEGNLREYGLGIAPSYTTDLSGELDSWRAPLDWMELEFASEDKIKLSSTRSFERIQESFNLGEEATVEPGDFDDLRHEITLTSNDRRLLNGRLSVELGDLYEGSLQRFLIAPVYIPGPLLTLGLEYEDIEVDLGAENFAAQLWSARADFSIHPRLALRNLIQYDSESRNLGAQSRLHWIRTPGQDLFLVGQFGWESEESGAPLVPTGQELALKLQYTLRF